jgi:hypothetical protein
MWYQVDRPSADQWTGQRIEHGQRQRLRDEVSQLLAIRLIRQERGAAVVLPFTLALYCLLEIDCHVYLKAVRDSYNPPAPTI